MVLLILPHLQGQTAASLTTPLPTTTHTHTHKDAHIETHACMGAFKTHPRRVPHPLSHTHKHTHTKSTQANQQRRTPLTVSPQTHTHSPTHTHATPLTLTGCTFGGWMLQLIVSVSSLTVWEHRGRETLKWTSYARERESVGWCGMQWKGVDEEKQSAVRDKRKGREGSGGLRYVDTWVE